MADFSFQSNIKSYCFGIALLALALAVAALFFFYNAKKTDVLISTVSVEQSAKTETLLTTVYRDKDVYADAFSQVKQDIRKSVPADIIVTSHHFLAAPLIARSYASVANPAIKRIILVSPDHFQLDFQNDNIAFTTDADWDALFGTISADKEFIDKLIENHANIKNTRVPFLREHGIYTGIPFLAHYFPQAKLVPLILKNNFNYDDFISFGSFLRQLDVDSQGTLVVISSDFSHYATHRSAQTADKKSIQVLENLRFGNFNDLNNDCRSCIAFAAGFEAENKSLTFHLIENKDSIDFGGENKDVTSYVSGYFYRKSITLLFGGDIMLDRYIRTVAKKSGNDFVFFGIKNVLDEADLVIANLEGPITNNKSVSETSALGSQENYTFTFDPSWAKTLKENNFSLVNIGNNHILNFNEAGVEQTKEFLKKTGVEYFGSPLARDKRIFVKDFDGTRIGFINYNQFINQGKEKALADITVAKKIADVVVLYAHWGKEYVPVLPAIRDLAHEFIDAGADIIIGSHPHIVQEKETYIGKMIYYSLGNLVFDQYFREETKKGLLVKMTIDPDTKKLSFEDIPIKIENNGQTFLDHKN